MCHKAGNPHQSDDETSLNSDGFLAKVVGRVDSRAGLLVNSAPVIEFSRAAGARPCLQIPTSHVPSTVTAS